MVTVRDFTKFRVPLPLSFELEKISRIFPYPGAENLIHLLVFPTYSPGWPGVLPLGKADDMCITYSIFASNNPLHSNGLKFSFLFSDTVQLKNKRTVHSSTNMYVFIRVLALLHLAIFLATCLAILLRRCDTSCMGCCLL